MTDVIAGFRTFLRLPITVDENTKCAILGIPFDTGTTNRPGARFAPSEIRNASFMLADGHIPENTVDVGDVVVTNGQTFKSLSATYDTVQQIWNDSNAKILSMGGDHTVTLPLLQAHSEKYGQLGLLHFDAHTDTWEADGDDSHGTWLRTAVDGGYVDPTRVVQVGIRSPMPDDVYQWTIGKGIKILPPEIFHFDNTNYNVAETLVGGPVYVTFDVDCIDPSQCPGTGTPEIGGLFTYQILHMLKYLSVLDVVGADVVEVCPSCDNAQITSLTAATIMCRLIDHLNKDKNG